MIKGVEPCDAEFSLTKYIMYEYTMELWQENCKWNREIERENISE